MSEFRGVAQITGCARTYPDPSTGSLVAIESPKRFLGQLDGHAIRFWSGSPRSDLIVGEGLENCPFLGGLGHRSYAIILSFWVGVIPQLPVLRGPFLNRDHVILPDPRIATSALAMVAMKHV